MSSELGYQPFQPSTLMERSFSNVSLSKVLNASIEHNLLSFFAIAQALKIRLLSITWQVARQAIEKNDIFKIIQTFANKKMNFVFKVFKNHKKFEKNETKIFQMFISEITVLNHSSIQKHLNIALLQNICMLRHFFRRQNLISFDV